MIEERRYAVQGRRDIEAERVAYAVEHMADNKAYQHAAAAAGGDPDGAILEQFRERFRAYRVAWRGNPRRAIANQLHHQSFAATGMTPQCVDIEVAAVCDLACPFCFRQWIATPDKLIREELYRRVIDQCAEMGVPSVKLNWRGEPLLHPKLPELVDYAKRAGILETLMNTNAVTLTEQKSRALIEAGLDTIIYSFDGGTKETYDEMRVGRFKENRFEDVYANIRRFAEIRAEMGARYPRTRIQMILTDKTFHEQDAFFELFGDCVDDVSVKAYTERGGKLHDLDEQTQQQLATTLAEKGIGKRAAYWRDLNGTLYVASGRLPCEQPYQRLMVTYDGRVSMCCYDWGSEHPIGYVDAEAFEEGDQHYHAAIEKAQAGAKGFQGLSKIRMPRRYNDPPKRVETLRQIWFGDAIDDVRQTHVEGRIEDVKVCRRCPFKETYNWVKLEAVGELPAG